MTGRELFAHRWLPKEGLGPLHNEHSCVGCHFRGGSGGGGPNEKNVDLLSVSVPPAMNAASQRKFVAQIHKLHPHFSRSTPNIVLHRFSVHPEYGLWRFGVLGMAAPRKLDAVHQLRALAVREHRMRQETLVTTVRNRGISLQLSERSTPGLFGAGQLDQISRDLLESIAANQATLPSGVSGRFSGRFGWRGQTRSLSEFVLGACANELGLQTENHKSALDPLKPEMSDRTDDLSAAESEKLIRFVSSLPAPKRVVPSDAQQKALVSNGESLFHSIGCAECHVRDLADVKDVFSDLLLHDMGPESGDPVAANPETRLVGQVSSPGTGYFGGGSVDVFEEIASNVTQEWRTPPLWGCADSAPYLHDGRAPNLHHAIMMHAGEATHSRRRYESLDEASRHRITAFLQTLRAPDAESLRQS